MSTRLLISSLPGEQRFAWLDAEGRLEKLRILRSDRPGNLDDVALGRVTAVDRTLKAAFVDIGLPRQGFLPLTGEERQPSEGEAVVVRVARAPSEGKGARLALATFEPLPAVAPPRWLFRADDPLNLLRRIADPPASILLDDLDLLRRLKEGARDRPEILNALTLVSGPAPLFDPGLEAAIDELLEPRVPLAGGAFLLIEPVATLTAIDVNSGSSREAAGRVNLAAVPAIARSLRLREISGLVVVDFLESASRAERQDLADHLRAALAEDHEPADLVRISGSGLAEITRRRARPPLHELLARRSGIGGSGWEHDPVALAFAALRKLAALPASAAARLLVSPAVGAALKGPAAAAFALVAGRRGGNIPLVIESGRSDLEYEALAGTDE